MLESWAEHTAGATGLHPDDYVPKLLADTDFLPAIKQHTPELLEEISVAHENDGRTPQ